VAAPGGADYGGNAFGRRVRLARSANARDTGHCVNLDRTREAAVPPDTPAGAQLGWLIAAMAHLPISDAEVRAHFDGDT